MLTILKVLMGVGAAAAALIAVLVVVAATRTSHPSQTAAPAHQPRVSTPHATPRGQTAASTPTVSAPQPTVVPIRPVMTSCQKSGSCHATVTCRKTGNCRSAVLALINQARSGRGLPPLALDHMQTFGTGNAGCVGTRGHTQAMAASGRLWRKSSRYRRASFPRDICGSVRHAAETVARGAGAKWHAIEGMQARLLTEGQGGRDYRHLMSRRYHRVGIDIERHGRYYYLTEDFLP